MFERSEKRVRYLPELSSEPPFRFPPLAVCRDETSPNVRNVLKADISSERPQRNTRERFNQRALATHLPEHGSFFLAPEAKRNRTAAPVQADGD